ncbi:MAG: response regulator [Candidatus Thermofonsia Clade 1 bacterium]|uniref:Response regulator n=1 Tax=Candidatus Thermofonsia Clade 1 bacterium TaxID=2364210 RepID=A0A2M8P2B8_9CHLR|nr:MAG: response regulator [Candidatus Thermofonsia Clade 1 bacterium]
MNSGLRSTMPKHILIVDDELDNVELFRMMLRPFNVELRSAQLGGEALEQAYQTPPALILLDLMLPDMSGFEVCAQLKAAPNTAQCYIAVLSGRNDETARQKALAAGADRFLVKPISRTDLKMLVEAVIGAS